MKTIKRTLATIMAIVMCFSMSAIAFAAEPSTPSEDPALRGNVIGQATYLVSDGNMTLVESNGDTSGIMPLSSIGGYNQKTISGGSGYITIDCESSGWGGMGFTIKTTCSGGTKRIEFAGAPSIGDGSSISGEMTTNDEVYFNNKFHKNIGEYMIFFNPASGETNIPNYLVQVWIYG